MCSGTSEDCRLSNVSFRYCRCSCCGCLNRWQRGHDATDAREKLEHGLPKQWGCLMHCYCFWRERKVLKCIKTINSVMTTGEGLWCVGSRLQFAKPTQIQWVLPRCGGRIILSCSLFLDLYQDVLDLLRVANTALRGRVKDKVSGDPVVSKSWWWGMKNQNNRIQELLERRKREPSIVEYCRFGDMILIWWYMINIWYFYGRIILNL